ncbi:MAG: SelT/SelW/SelH family protein [Anaerolineae bacterium]
MPNAVSLTEEILEEFGQRISSFKIIPSGGGRFEVTVDGQLVFSKAELHRFPEPNEVRDKIVARMS